MISYIVPRYTYPLAIAPVVSPVVSVEAVASVVPVVPVVVVVAVLSCSICSRCSIIFYRKGIVFTPILCNRKLGSPLQYYYKAKMSADKANCQGKYTMLFSNVQALNDAARMRHAIARSYLNSVIFL